MFDIFVDPCNPSLCENGGICVNNNGDAKCTCINGFTGDKCEQLPNGKDIF